MDRPNKLSKTSILGWLSAIAALADAGLLVFYDVEIVRSWPWSKPPGTAWAMNAPAAIFWTSFLICLALFTWREMVLRDDAKHVQRRTKVVTIGVWTGILASIWWVWQTRLIASPPLFWGALIGLLLFSAAFASAETAFTILQSNDTEVSKARTPGNLGAKTILQEWVEKEKHPSKFFQWRYQKIEENVSDRGFATLLPFLLVMNSLTNLGGMYLIGKGLTPGGSSNAFSFVISAVIVVIVGEVAAKFYACRFVARTASLTAPIIFLLKPPLRWITSSLVIPIEAAIEKWTKNF